MTRSQLPVLLGALFLGAAVTFLYLFRERESGLDVPPPEPTTRTGEDRIDRSVEQPLPTVPENELHLPETQVDTPSSPLEALENAGVGKRMRNPETLMTQIGEALEAGDFDTAGNLIGSAALTPEAKKQLAALASSGPIRLLRPDPAREVGEMQINALSRWALHLDGAGQGRDRIFFDLDRKEGRWGVSSVALPPVDGSEPPPALHLDSLGIADAFLQAAFRQEFETAKSFVDTSSISDAKIAGLCILFEEGKYRMRPQKPLRAMFQRENAAGYLANVLAGDGSELAQFSMTLNSGGQGVWKIREINLDQLLADYATRVAGGDVHYTPLLKNPKGGDTLVLYFGFDEDGLTPRTQRQLEIVSDLLRLDPDKKLTISGHTDALGTEQYNDSLSARRAVSVKKFLVETGVAEEQVITVAEGKSQPRRPNFTESGEDDPAGRRANRRTEIYLDF